MFAGVNPTVDIYEPLWRIWGVLLGAVVVAMAFFILWPEYAGDSLLPRLQRVIGGTLALAPSGSASTSEDQILKTNSGTMHVLTRFSRLPTTRSWKDVPAPSTILRSSRQLGLSAGLRTSILKVVCNLRRKVTLCEREAICRAHGVLSAQNPHLASPVK